MKLDCNINNNKIELLDCQVDLVLKCLEFYSYMYQFMYPRSGKSETKEENLKISLVTDTYHQILNQYKNPKIENDINKLIRGFDDKLKKVS